MSLAACSSTPATPSASGPYDAVPATPTSHQDTAFATNGPYKPGVAFETTPEVDTVVLSYPVDPSVTVGKPAFASIATDGCSPPDISPPTAWPLIDQVVTAQLRYGLGIDTTPVGLGSGLDLAFDGVTASVRASPAS